MTIERDPVTMTLDSIRRCTNIAKGLVQRLEVAHARVVNPSPELVAQLATARKLRDEMLAKQDQAERDERRYRELEEQARALEEKRRAARGES